MSKCSVFSTANLKESYSTLLRPKYWAERAAGVPKSRRAGPKAPSRRKRARIRDGLPRMRGPVSTHTTFPIGSFRMRLPVSANTALHTAGAIGGVPGSPTPPCASLDGTMYTSTAGISAIFSIL